MFELSKNDVSVKMPQGIASLFFIQIVATLSYSVLYSTLVLYMSGRLGLSSYTSNSIMGIFVAFNFGLHLLGGFLGGRFFSNRGLFALGMVSQVIGCILLSFGNEAFLYYGLAAFLTGSGLNVTCVNCMLTQRFSPQDNRREKAFLWNYAGMNIGFFAGFTMSGYFQLSQDYSTLFMASSIGNLLALMICFYSWTSLNDLGTDYITKTKAQKRQANFSGIFIILALPLVLSQMLHHAEFANKIVLLSGLFMLVYIVVLALQQKTQELRHKMFVYAVLLLVGTVFWMLSQLAPMGLTYFIDNNINRSIMGMIIPPQWFQNINTITIVIGGPLLGLLLAYLRKRKFAVNIPAQFALALLLIGIAFVILPVSILFADSQGYVSPSWIVGSYFLQSVGELLISPIGYAMIGYLAPQPLQGIMMGMWLLNIGVGSTLASYCSNMMTSGIDSTSPLATNPGYSHVFLILGLIALATGMLLYLITPKLRVWMGEEKVADSEKQDLALA